MKGKFRLALCSLVITALLLGASPALADGPTLPHVFYGTVTINGAAAPTGTVVSAKVGGVDCGSYTIKVDGHYGNLDERDYLAVQGDISNGDTITFHVSGILTDTDTFSAGGGPTEKNLALVITDESITGEVEESIPPAQTDYVVDASNIADTTVTVDTTGEVTITVKKYYSNPHPEVTELPAEMLPRYIDIEVDNPAAILWPMYVEQTYTQAEVAGFDESSLGMYYFQVGNWRRCSDTGVNEDANYVWANMTEDETSGSPVAIGGTKPEPPPAGGGGITLPTPAGTTDVRGKMTTAGRFTEPVTATSEDELCTLTIPEGTVGLTEELEPLDEITMVIMDEPPPPHEDDEIVGLSYDFGPDGATFDPPITLEYTYDPDDIPDWLDEEDLVIAMWDEDVWNEETDEWGIWVVLEGCTVDKDTHTITAPVSHFTTFAVIARRPLAPPPPPAPAAFSVSDLSIGPAEVQPKEAVTITVSVANTGGTEGSYTVVLKINGVKEAETRVTVAAGSTRDVSFSVTKEEAGTYRVTMDGLTASFTVVAPAPPLPKAPPPKVEVPFNWTLLAGIIGVVVAVGLLIFILMRRRAL